MWISSSRKCTCTGHFHVTYTSRFCHITSFLPRITVLPADRHRSIPQQIIVQGRCGAVIWQQHGVCMVGAKLAEERRKIHSVELTVGTIRLISLGKEIKPGKIIWAEQWDKKTVRCFILRLLRRLRHK